jgi:lipoprotein-anchoring transpeptidase ErfK/SrfK
MRWNKLPSSVKVGTAIVLSLGSLGAVYNLLVRSGYIFPVSLWNEILCEACDDRSNYHQPPIGAETIPNPQPLVKLLANRVDKGRISILIEKSQHRLTIYYDKGVIKSYPIVLGDRPKGDKLLEGDRRTPEGIFHIKDAYPHPQWSKFLWLDYPNASSWRKHLAAKQTGEIPWYKSIGRDVGIHGVPVDNDKLIDKQVNWTWGCISLKKSDVDEIYQILPVGTLVEILP